MDNILTAINGSESADGIQNNHIKALINFYKAFNGRNMALMKDVWLNNSEVSMNNPVGGVIREWSNIEQVYDRIFNGKATVFVEFYDFKIIPTSEMFIVSGRERGYLEQETSQISLHIRTSRVFVKENNDWKQIHHHGSIDDPQLLEKYQGIINSGKK